MNPILISELPKRFSPLMARVTAAYARDETEHVNELLEQARLDQNDQANVQSMAAGLVNKVRIRAADPGLVEAFMREYDLSS